MVATCIGSGMEQLTSKTGGSAWALGGPSDVRYRQVSDRKQIPTPLYTATFKSPDSLLAPDCFLHSHVLEARFHKQILVRFPPCHCD